MAAGDVAITAANIAYGSTATGLVTSKVILGETFTGMQPAYADDSYGGKYKLAISTDDNKFKVAGLIFGAGDDGDVAELVTNGRVVVGGTLVPGRRYVLSSTSGLMMLDSSLTTGDNVFDIGIAMSTSELFVNLYDWGLKLS